LSAVVGERDRILRGTVPRNINPTLGKSLLIDVDPPAFHQNSAGMPTFSSAKFTATPVGFVGTVLWSITSGGKLTGTTPNERTLLFDDMTAEAVTVTATIVYDGQAYLRTKTFYKLTDGKNGTDADPTDLSPEALAAALENRITESQLSADLRSRIDLVDGPASNPSTVQGQIKKETDLRVSAINQEIADRIAALVAEAGARTTYVQSFTYSKQDITNAISIKADAITAAYTAYADSTKAQAKADAAADVRQYAYSKADIDSSEAAQTNTITTNYKSYADGVGAAATSNSNSYIQTYAYGKSTIDSTLASLATQLRSEFTDNNGVSVAYLSNYAFSKAETNSAISSATQTLSTTVGQHTTSIQSQATSIDGLSGQLVWKIDNNGHVTGFGLASTPINGVPYSTMIFNVDVLAVALPGGTGKPIFTVGQVNGQSQAVFRTELFVDGAITARMLKIGTSDNIVPDPAFNDLWWWDRPTATVVQESSFWRGGATLFFTPANANVATDRSSHNFPLTPGATYWFEMQVGLSEDFQGQLSIGALIPGVGWHQFGKSPAGENWPDGYPMQFNGSSTKGNFTFGEAYTVPDNGAATYSNIRTRVYVLAGACKVGSISITRVVDSTLIGPGVVQTKHLELSNGGNIALGTTGYDAGNGLWFEGPGSGHGARLFAGNSAGKKFLCDPQNGVLGLFGADINSPNLTLAPFSANAGGDVNVTFTNGPVRTVATRTVTVSGGTAPYSYTWAGISAVEGGFLLSNNTTATVTVRAGGFNQVRADTISVVVRDNNGLIATSTFNVAATYGTPPAE
jgi:hypothetical protein